MKFLILVSSVLALVSASWEPIHDKYHGPLHYPTIHKGVPVEPAAVQHARVAHLSALAQASHNSEHHEHHEHNEPKWHGPQHYPVIYKGVPVEPAEVQHAREAHLKALSHASHHYGGSENNHYGQYQGGYEHHEEEGRKWNGPLHYPKIYKGVPVEPKEVQHARVAHFKALSEIKHSGGDYESHNHYEIPRIGHDGKPMDTQEVEVAKSKHFAAVHDALARNSHGISHHYRKRRGAQSYVHFSNIVEHAVPVYQHMDSHYDNDDDETHAPVYGHQEDNFQGFSYHQTHAPVYGHQEDGHGNSLGFSYQQTHAPVYGHHDDTLGYSHRAIYTPVHGHHNDQALVIGHDGMPVDTIEVQKAKAAHLAAHAAAKSKHY